MKKYLIIISLLAMFFIWQNNTIVISNFEYRNPKIPVDFNDFKIVQISDLHNKKFGDGQSKLLKKIDDLQPDIIVVTGDLVDRRKFNIVAASDFMEGAVKIAPVYYVSGNHEAWSGKYKDIKEMLETLEVHVLDDISAKILKNDSEIEIMGLSDPDFLTSSYMEGTKTDSLEKALKFWKNSDREDKFRILLSHRPELFQLYAENDMNLIFSGHAHGGQVRIPFIGGLIAPDQGFFPEYTSGSYIKNNSTMFVSRGLGNSIIPLRVFNPPEIVEVTLKIFE